MDLVFKPGMKVPEVSHKELRAFANMQETLLEKLKKKVNQSCKMFNRYVLHNSE